MGLRFAPSHGKARDCPLPSCHAASEGRPVRFSPQKVRSASCLVSGGIDYIMPEQAQKKQPLEKLHGEGSGLRNGIGMTIVARNPRWERPLEKVPSE